MKRTISVVLVLLILLSCTIIPVSAAPNDNTIRYSVLILDGSGSMSGAPINAQRIAAEKFCDALLSASGTNYVAIVKIDSSASKLCDFTDDIDTLKYNIGRVYDNGGTNTKQALDIADNLLDSIENQPNLVKNIILCSDGLPQSGATSTSGPYTSSDYSSYSYANAVYNKAMEITNEGTFIYALGFFHSLSGSTLTFGRRFMNDLGNAGYYEVTNPDELEFTFGDIAQDVINEVKEITFLYQSGLDYNARCYYTNDYFAESSYIFNPHLATMSMSFAMSAFGSATGGETDYSNKSKNARLLLEDIGVETDKIAVNSWFTKKPSTDSIGVVAGNMPIRVNGTDYTLIAVALRGSGYEAEWAGNFAIGKDGLHEGFETARDEVISFLGEYIRNQNISGNIKLWLTGYSRSAATANLVSGALHTASSRLGTGFSLSANDIYTYCFETPAGVLREDVNGSAIYNNIFNIINSSDPVPYVAPASLGFGRYGVDKYVPSAESSPRNYSNLRSQMRKIYDTMESASNYVVDDFKMKKIGFDWGVKIMDDNNNNWSQGVYLSKYVSIISNEYIKSRTLYVDCLQNEIREVLSVAFGASSEKSKKMFDLFVEKAKDGWPGLVLSYIWNVGVNPFGNEYDALQIVSNWLTESIEEAGITGYDKATIESAGKKISDLFLAVITNHPNYFTTALNNKDGIVQAHISELCYSWLASMDSYYDEGAQVSFNNGGYRIIRINCAVDVSVSDSDGKLVASITDESPDDIPGSSYISGVDEDGQKYVILPVDEDYTITITGREDDTVDYGVLEYSAEAGNYARNVNYFDVPVTKGESLVATASAYSDEEIEVDPGTGSSAEYTLTAHDGELVEVSSDLSGDDVSLESFTVTASSSNAERGTTTGSGLRYFGEHAKVEAIANGGYKFAGWYKDDKLISTDEAYRVKVDSDIALTAAFDPRLIGDANLDDDVDITDATTIQRFDAKLIELSYAAMMPADADQDGDVCIVDATWIQRKEANMKAPECVGKFFGQ